MSSTIDTLLDGNRHFMQGEFQPNTEYDRAIATKQTPKVLRIGCSESRVSEHPMKGSKPGTRFVHRNAANVVAFNDGNISAILECAMVHLKIEDIIVCGHTRCGGIAAIEDGVHEKYIADWLCIASGAKGPLPRIHGWLYRIEEGQVDVLVDGRNAAGGPSPVATPTRRKTRARR